MTVVAGNCCSSLSSAREPRHYGGMPWEEPTAVQLRVTLLDIEPAIWRQLVVPWRFHLGQLHRVIQAAFGWWDDHLHEFTIGGLRFVQTAASAADSDRSS